MPFAAGQVVTNKGKASLADRWRTTPSTYTNPPKYLGMGVGATGAARTAAVADTALSTEVESRTAGTESNLTTSQTGDTHQVLGTITASATRAVDEVGLFDASTSGNMVVSATHTVLNLANGDAIQYTIKTQLT